MTPKEILKEIKSESDYQKMRFDLWEYLVDRHDLILLDSEIDEIINIVEPKSYPYLA